MHCRERRLPTFRGARILASALLLFLLAGCGAHESAVTGKVTIDGAPFTSGTVAFYPAAGGAAAYGSIQSDGAYTLETGTSGGLAAGDYVATVVATTPPQPGFPFGKMLAPVRYNNVKTSDLKFTVKVGSNKIDLPLQSK